jgi:replicative DNA helicase
MIELGFPPSNTYNLELEKAAIRSALFDGSLTVQLMDDDFFEVAHRLIFTACREDYLKNKNCDLFRIDYMLKGQEWYDNIRGLEFLLEICNGELLYPKHTPQHDIINLLRELRIKRLMFQQKVTASGAREMIAEGMRNYQEWQNLLPENALTPEQILEALYKAKSAYLTLGFPILDALIQMEPGQLIVIGGRTGTGKSAFLCNVACNMVLSGRNVLFCTKEMSAIELQRRFLSYFANKPFTEISKEEAKLYLPLLEKIHIVEKMDFISDIEAAIARSDADFIIVDYIQLLTVQGRKSEYRVGELEEITRRLKGAAQRSGKVLLCAAQLNRELDTANRPPVLKDLRGCGSIEQDANVVILMFDPNAKESDEPKGNEKASGWGENQNFKKQVAKTAAALEGSENMIEFYIRKNRAGSTGMKRLKWLPSITAFRDPSFDSFVPPLPQQMFPETENTPTDKVMASISSPTFQEHPQSSPS